MDCDNGGGGRYEVLSMYAAAAIEEASPDEEEEVDATLERLRQSLLAAAMPDEIGLAARMKEDSLLQSLSPSLSIKPWCGVGRVSIVGRRGLGCVTKPRLAVAMAVEIPRSWFNEKDYLDNRYYARRQAFLHVIAFSLLSDDGEGWEVKWACFAGNDVRKMVLEVRSKRLKDWVVRVLAVPEKDAFDMRKLVPTRSNLRGQSMEGGSTPSYNNGIAEDAFLRMHFEKHLEIVQRWLEASDALVLLQVWARNRGLVPNSNVGGHGVANSFAIRCLALDALVRRAPAPTLSAFSIFRLMLAGIGDVTKAVKKGPSYSAGVAPDSGPPTGIGVDWKALSDSGKLVLLDATGVTNLVSRLGQAAVHELALQARRSHIILQDDKQQPAAAFQRAIMSRILWPTGCDLVMHVQPCARADPESFQSDATAWDADEAAVAKLLRKAIPSRVTVVRTSRAGPPNLTSMADAVEEFNTPIVVGMTLNPKNMGSLIDRGPSADDVRGSEEFRNFWGKRAELRRFRDGTVAESVVWKMDDSQKHNVSSRAAATALSQNMSSASVISLSGQLDALLRSRVISKKQPQITLLLSSFELLQKHLLAAEGTTLKITAVHPISEGLRGTAVHEIVPSPAALAVGGINIQGKVDATICPHECAIQLEGSGRWPTDPSALSATKTSFLLVIGESLASGAGLHSVAANETLDVFVNGFLFRIKLYLDVLGLDGDIESAIGHARTITALAGKEPNFPTSVRLAKRWISAHMFSLHISSEVVELCVAACFLCVGPKPQTRIAGLLAFLRLLVEHDWETEPLIVDPNNDMDSKARYAAYKAFQQSRSKERAKSPNMYIVTPRDYSSASVGASTFYCSSPDKNVLSILTAHARTSLRHLEGLLNPSKMSSNEGAWLQAFKPNLRRFDILIHLEADVVRNRDISLSLPVETKRKRNVLRLDIKSLLDKGHERGRRMLLIGFDAVQDFVEELVNRYGSIASFYYDCNGGAAIGILWRPNAFVPESLRLNSSHSLVPVSCEGHPRAVPSVVELLADIAALGAGIVSDIVVH